ncbi:unnamed protein product [Rotaria magnacalcarata]|uniref:Uncharacterized protein n=1 Tax=Rotaria magnacalcarata TaxID=392030 RepID=A0A8S2KW24_9BILA|nr:unnamed protein product [Rotaria magnacalcarata]
MIHSIKLNQMIGYSVLLIIFLLPSNIYVLANFKTACELLKLPRECHCQRTRGVPLSSLNETRLRCRQFTKITSEYNWSIVQYDRLAFETPTDNLILDRFAFADIRARTLRFNVRHLFLNDHALYNAYIGQLAMSCTDDYGTINLESNGQVLYGATITNVLVKSIDLQIQISELFFSNSIIYTLLIESSKFYGFTNKKFITPQQYETNTTNENQYENFLEYDSILTPNSSFDLSDVAFCLLSHFNQTFFHISRQHSCLCNVHYLYNNPDIHRNGSYSTVTYHTNYLRLTPICIQSETSSSFEQYPHENEPMEYSNSSDFIIQNLGDNCNYKLIFLDCDAMTTTTASATTTATTTTTTTFIDMSSLADNRSTAESLLNAASKPAPLPTTTPWFFKYTKPTPRSANNAKKLFTVLGTLIAITVAAVILVIIWYRLKRLYIQKQKRKKVEQKRGLNLISSNTITNHPQTTAPRYASSDMLSSLYSGQSMGNKNQSQTLIARASPPSTIYKNVDALNNDSIQSIDHEESQQQLQSQNLTNGKTIEIEDTTEC